MAVAYQLLDDLDRLVSGYVVQLRERTGALADAPSRHGWLELRNIVRGAQRWRSRAARALPAGAASDRMLLVLASLDAAVREAQELLRDLGPQTWGKVSARAS